MEQLNNNIRICLPHSLCGNFRTCPRCARIRQAKIANAVQKLASECGDLTWSIAYPHGGGAKDAAQAKMQFLKAIKPEGAIWSIEQSRKNGNFHVNIITPTCENPQLRKAQIWQQAITGDVRNVGAYIGKRSQMPKRDDYSGKLWGTAGNLWQILSNAADFPIVQGAAAQYAINSHAMINRAAELLEIEKKLTEVSYNPELDRKRADLIESIKNKAEIHALEMNNRSDFINVEDLKHDFDKEAARDRAARWLPDILEKQRERLRADNQKKNNE